MPVGVRAPTHNGTVDTDSTRIPFARRDFNEFALRDVALARSRDVTPTLNSSVRTQSARSPISDANRLESSRGVGPARESPAFQRAVKEQAASMEFADADGQELSIESVRLPVTVRAPTLDGTVDAQPASAVGPCRDRYELPLGGVGLPKAIVTPTPDRAPRLQATRILLTGADRFELPLGGVGLPKTIVTPTPDRAPRLQATCVLSSDCDRDPVRRIERVGSRCWRAIVAGGVEFDGWAVLGIGTRKLLAHRVSPTGSVRKWLPWCQW